MMEYGSMGMSFDKPLPPSVSERVNFRNTGQGAFVFPDQNSNVDLSFLP
jgi:hypothetical protein